MKYILPLLLLLAAACTKDSSKHFVLEAYRADSMRPASVAIDDEAFLMTGTTVRRDIQVGDNETVHVSIRTNDTVQTPVSLSLYDGTDRIAYDSGIAEASLIINRGGSVQSVGAYTSGSSSASSGTGSAPSSGGGCPSVQCSGTTQRGKRCSRTTTNCSGRCYQHD